MIRIYASLLLLCSELTLLGLVFSGLTFSGLAFGADEKRAIVLVRHGHDSSKVAGVPESSLWEYNCWDANDDGEAKCSDNNHWVYHFSDPESSEITIKVRRLDAKGRQHSSWPRYCPCG